MRRLLCVLACVLTCGCAGQAAAAGPPPDRWGAFLQHRDGYLRQLGTPILACNARHDTAHPAFHGCVDWHSAVHATYALLALNRLTGDPAYRDAAEATLAPGAVAAELADVRAHRVDAELPYGFAWFLALAVERERSGGHTDLRPLATEIAARLRSWVVSLSDADLERHSLSNEYDNLSWAAVNLWAWGRQVSDSAASADATAVVRRELGDARLDQACPPDRPGSEVTGFLPPCLLRAMAILAVLPAQEVQGWRTRSIPAQPAVAPVRSVDPANPHPAGLNFSRSWAFWTILRATGLPAYRDRLMEHVDTHMAQPQYWATDYGRYAHWVAQFGVYALAQTYD
jgi:hypothetical protein